MVYDIDVLDQIIIRLIFSCLHSIFHQWTLACWSPNHEYYPRQARQWVFTERRHGPQLSPQHDHVQPFTSSGQLHAPDLTSLHVGSAPRDDPEEGAWLSWPRWWLSPQYGYQTGEAQRVGLPPSNVCNRNRNSRRKKQWYAGHVAWQPPEYAFARPKP